jgi:hypothetical protein
MTQVENLKLVASEEIGELLARWKWSSGREVLSRADQHGHNQLDGETRHIPGPVQPEP